MNIADMNKMNLTKQKIMRAAIVLFANKGFDCTTTREICKAAGVNLSMISYYFKTKEGLYINLIESIVDYGLSTLAEYFEKAKNIDDYSKEEKIDIYRKFLEAFVGIMYSELVPSCFVILMIKEQTNPHSRFSDMYGKKIEKLYSALRKIVASIMGKKENDKVVIFEVSKMISQILSMKIMDRANLSALKQEEYTSDDKKRIIKIILKNVENNINFNE